jgi:hypothetical protein
MYQLVVRGKRRSQVLPSQCHWLEKVDQNIIV